MPALIGAIAVLGALIWFAWCIVRMVIGPARGKALKHAGLAILVFIGGGMVMGIKTPTTPKPSAPLEASAPNAATVLASTAPQTSPELLGSHLAISGTYQLAPTMTGLVISGYAAGDEADIEKLMRSQCNRLTFCAVGIWQNDDEAPRKLKMTDAQLKARLAQYVVSPKNKINRIVWNCDLVPEPTSSCPGTP